MVKAGIRLSIPLSDATEDTVLDAKLVEADAEINIILGRYTTVPLTGTIPQEIKDIAADKAAARYEEDKDSRDPRITAWRTRAEKNLADYIATNYGPKPYVKATSYAVIKEE